MLVPLLSLGLALIDRAQAASAPAKPIVTKYNLTMADTATILQYSDPNNVTAAEGWNQSYSGTPWTEYDTGILPEGDSSHTTSKVGASVSVNFAGTGVYFWGSGQGSVALNVDGQELYTGELSAAAGVLAGVRDLEYKAHTATLSLTSGTVVLTNVTLTTVIGGDGAIPVVDEITSLDEADFTNKAQLDLVGTWQENNRFCGSSVTATSTSFSCETYDCLSSNTVGASIKMAVPANASIATMHGAVGSSHGPYDVLLNPAPPGMPAKQSFSASKAWLDKARLLYYTSLDPNTRYTMQIIFTGTSSQVIEWGKASFVVVQGGEPWTNVTAEANKDNSVASDQASGVGGVDNTGSAPVGAIAGGVVGGVAALAIIGGLIWWFCRRRKVEYTSGGEKLAMAGIGRKKRWRHSVLSDFEVDVLDQTNQSGTPGTYHPEQDPERAAASRLPHSAENTITPLPAPYSGGMVGPERSSSSNLSEKKVEAKQLLLQMNNNSGGLSPNSVAYGYPLSPAGLSPGTPQSATPPFTGYPPQAGPATSGGSPFADPPGLSPQSSDSPHSPAQPWGKGPRFPPQRPTVVTEAEDAGRVQAAPAPVHEQVPPRYNPAWADEQQ